MRTRSSATGPEGDGQAIRSPDGFGRAASSVVVPWTKRPSQRDSIFIMQLPALIPFVAVLVAAAFAAAASSWESDRRATGAMTAIFGCIGAWAFIDLASQLESDPGRAMIWHRLIHLPVLLLGAFVVRLVAQILPGSSSRLRRFSRAGFAASLLLGLAGAVLPGTVVGITPTAWGGWMPRYGIVSIVLLPLASVLPAVAAYHAWRMAPGLEAGVDRLRSNAFIAAVLVSLVAALSTEYVFPLLGIPMPRLGAIICVMTTVAVWMHVLHRSDDLVLTPQGTARAVLSELHDGVALIEIDGTILSSNPRLATMTGRRSSELMGMRLCDLVDAPLDAIRTGLEDHEFGLSAATGKRVPVSLSSSCVRDRGGVADWFVVVFRDLRSVEALRRRLLTSGRLAAIGELAAGIAHEVNNPIAFIRSDLNFLRCRLDEIHARYAKESEAEGLFDLFEDGASRIVRALDGVERVAEVVGDVRGFSHVGADCGVIGNPGVILEGAIRLARLERREEVALHVKETDFCVSVHAGQDLKQVLLALLRVLTVSSRTGSDIEIEPAIERAFLRIRMTAHDMVDRAQTHVERFRGAREEALEASTADLGLAIAIELADQMGAGIDVAAIADDAMQIELRWPLEAEDVG